MIKFRSVFERCEASELNQIDAAVLFGVSERTSAGGACALKTAAKPAYWTVVWARPRTGGYRWSRNSRSRPCIGPGTAASPPSTSTNTWCASIRSAGATPGPRCSCNRGGCCHPPRRAPHTGASAIYSGFLVPEEGIASTFQALLEVFGRHGLPLSLYSDRGSHHFYTPELVVR